MICICFKSEFKISTTLEKKAYIQDVYTPFIQPEIEVTVIRAVLLSEHTQSPSGAGLRLDTRYFNFFLDSKAVDSSSFVKFQAEISINLYGINRTGKTIFLKPV